MIIDLPQAVDIVANPEGMDLLMRDCHNVCAWFVARGLDVDEQELFAELMAVGVVTHAAATVDRSAPTPRG